MPYLILAIGLLIGLYTLYRFFMGASIKQIKASFLVAILVTIAIALFFLALSGRLPAALALLAAMIPVMAGLWKNNSGSKSDESNIQKNAPLTRKDALEILGLKESASEKDIQSAYKKLMQKLHPDNEGSDWMAAKLNAARDMLLKK